MKKILATFGVLAALWGSPALAQCNGSFSNGQICGVASGGPKLPGPSAANNFLTAVFPPATVPGTVVYWNGSNWVILAGNASGTRFLQETSAGVPSWVVGLVAANNLSDVASQATAQNNLFPTPTRAGDIVYWNGSAWITLAGNNSGTQILTENSSGVPSWAASGSVSSVTIAAGQGISATGTCTITTSGTCTIAVSLTTASNILGADVALNNTANYFDGPSMAQGTTGTWFASGNVTLSDSAAQAAFNCKLWDGTTVIESGRNAIVASGQFMTMHLAGILASPAANIRISCNDPSATTGSIKFNASGNSKDSAIYGFRIQ